jgi:hypothetical protein
MKRIRLILEDFKLPTDAPGKSWGVPMIGDTFMLHDPTQSNIYFTVKTIKHVPGGTRYSVEENSKMAAFNRQTNRGYQEFIALYINKSKGLIAFKEVDC